MFVTALILYPHHPPKLSAVEFFSADEGSNTLSCCVVCLAGHKCPKCFRDPRHVDEHSPQVVFLGEVFHGERRRAGFNLVEDAAVPLIGSEKMVPHVVAPLSIMKNIAVEWAVPELF